MKLKNIKRDEQATSDETRMAERIIQRTFDDIDDPQDLRVIVIVATGKDNGRIGCAFEGYADDDMRVMLDLQLLAQAIDLGGDA